MPGFSIGTVLAAALCHPDLQAATVILATFVLEDAATVITAMQAQAGVLSVPVALGALYTGIVLGDLGLYGLGALAARLPVVRRLLPPQRRDIMAGWVAGRIFRIVLISRFLPGVRLPVYTTCGYIGADFLQFALATALGTAVWTTGLFAVSWRIGALLAMHLAVWRWVGAIGTIAVLMLAGQLLRLRLQPIAGDD
jgi:membrane protein DedA with SNARE-associated domain